MALIVQKYGGAVLSHVEKIRKVAKQIAEIAAAGNQIVAVVSAMGQTTDDLVRLAYSVCREPQKREMDMLLSVGERMSMSLLAMAIEDTGKATAVSFTGSQVGIITDTRHTDARIVEIRNMRIQQALDQGKVVVIAGFQGVSLEKEITTLGRGGSDTTAVALAAALGADRCDLIKEVPGIFSSDPTVIPEALPIPEMDYSAASGMSLGGARILQNQCVELAKRYRIELRVGNFDNSTIVKEKSAEPFFNLVLQEGYNLYRSVNLAVCPECPEILEYLEIGGDRYVLANTRHKFFTGGMFNSAPVAENLARITAVGDSAEKVPAFLAEETLLQKIICTHYYNRETRVYFQSDDSEAVLKNTHEKMRKILLPEEKSDGGQ